MADIDDILGDGPSKEAPQVKSSTIDSTTTVVDGDLDDILSGAPAAAKAASPVSLLDDDLFGPGPSRTAESAHSAPLSAAPAPHNTVVGNIVRDLVVGSSDRPRHGPINVPVVTPASEKLKPCFISPNGSEAAPVYFAKFVQVFSSEAKRERFALAVTDANIVLYRPPTMDIAKKISLNAVLGVLCQPTLVSKAFGLSKDYEMRYLVQVEGASDLFFSIGMDADNGPINTSLADIPQVLSAICYAYGTVITVSEVGNDEPLVSMVKWHERDDPLRRQYSETLAYRTELQHELNNLTSLESQFTTTIETLKNSSATQSSKELYDEIAAIQNKLSELASEVERGEAIKRQSEHTVAALTEDLERESRRRLDAVKKNTTSSSQSTLQAQVSEYEIMKAAHRREMDHIAALTAFSERRLQALKSSPGGQGVFQGNQLALRIDDLDEEHRFLTELVAEISESHQFKNEALIEAKKRLASAKSTLAEATADLERIRAVPTSEPLPKGIRTDPHPLFDTVVPAKPQARRPSAHAKSAVHSIPSAAAPQAATQPVAKAPIDLDVDDDDI